MAELEQIIDSKLIENIGLIKSKLSKVEDLLKEVQSLSESLGIRIDVDFDYKIIGT